MQCSSLLLQQRATVAARCWRRERDNTASGKQHVTLNASRPNTPQNSVPVGAVDSNVLTEQVARKAQSLSVVGVAKMMAYSMPATHVVSVEHWRSVVAVGASVCIRDTGAECGRGYHGGQRENKYNREYHPENFIENLRHNLKKDGSV